MRILGRVISVFKSVLRGVATFVGPSAESGNALSEALATTSSIGIPEPPVPVWSKAPLTLVSNDSGSSESQAIRNGGNRRHSTKPVSVRVSTAEQKKLRRIIRKRTVRFEIGLRAKIVLTLAEDPGVSKTARSLGVSRPTVRLWRDRFHKGRCDGLKSRKSPGRPASISDVSRCHIIALACGQPKDFNVPYRPIWTTDVLLHTYRNRNPDLDDMSATTVRRILERVDLKPHKFQNWLHSPDPKFREKVNDVCALYRHPPEDSIVFCIDEKTGMQALGRKHPTKPAKPGKKGRKEFEYIRLGTRSLIAAFNPHSGEVFGRVGPTRTASDLVEFMEALVQAYPAKHIHVVWDNLNTHYDGPSKRWTEFNTRHQLRFHFHYTPIHASWVNQPGRRSG